MRLEAAGVRIADVETCDFRLMEVYATAGLLRAARPDDAERYLGSASARRLIAGFGVEFRHLTHIPGRALLPGRLNALDLARSAVNRLRARRPGALERLDAVIFVSTSNPHPCNSQAALLAAQCGLSGSCFDLKGGCSGGVLGLLQGALMIRSGCERVLVVMAETLSQFTPPEDLRMLLTVGDGAACVLLERAAGPGFLAMLHGTEPALSNTMTVSATFPPSPPDARYLYEFHRANEATVFLHQRWRALFCESLGAAGVASRELAYALFHQTHAAQVRGLQTEMGLSEEQVPTVVSHYGNMGTPTFAVALTRVHANLRPCDRYLMQAVGGGVSWCAIVAEHQ
jgi:3-oxoacyl-[acyl-carrier-protein] synthase-3